MGSSLLVNSILQFPALLGETGSLSWIVNFIWLAFQVGLGLGFVIFVHELGHFLAAKTFGVKCDKFYVGFDVPISIGPIHLPRTLGKFQWGETEYGIGIIPLGGYVKMLGQDDDPRKAEEEAERIKVGEGTDAKLDPRSYPAKKVWQRMIIISAGVVMNLIFAVILAAIAFGFGVPYTPTVVGSAQTGGPAWIAGLSPGDQIVRVGDMNEDSMNMRFEEFAGNVVMRGMESNGGPVPVTILHNGQRQELSIPPTNKFSRDKNIYLIGVKQAALAQLSKRDAVYPYSVLAAQKVDLKPLDRFVAVKGQPLPVDDRFGVTLSHELTARLQADWEKSVTVTIERTENNQTKKFDIELPPVPVKTLGFGFKIGTVSAVRKGSLGDQAGIQVGDTIEQVNGQPVQNALALPNQIAKLHGQEIELGIRRSAAVNSGQTETPELTKVRVKPEGSVSFDAISEVVGVLPLPGLGIAVNALPIVSEVTSENSSATSNVAVGDELVQVLWEPTDETKKELAKVYTPAAFEPRQIDSLYTIASLFGEWQQMPEGMQVRCYFRRAGKSHEAVMTIAAVKDWYWYQRGLAMQPLEHYHRITSLQEALVLGFGETKKRLFDVFKFLRILVSGKASRNGVGGPIAIFGAAGSEASQGVSRLLLFLTMLSANLAILNFLPIPALDGGHMVFLLAEAVRGKPVNEALQMQLTLVGVLCLLGLMAFVTVNDILRYF